MASLLEQELETLQRFKDKAGYWTEYPEHPVEDWRAEIANDDTRQGYWEWVADRIEDTILGGHLDEPGHLFEDEQDDRSFIARHLCPSK